MAISLLCSILGLLIALWFGPVSLSFLLYIGLLSLVVAPLLLLGWSRTSALARFVGVMIFLLAQRPIRALAFPERDYWAFDLLLSLQYVTMFLVGMCTISLLYAWVIVRRKQQAHV